MRTASDLLLRSAPWGSRAPADRLHGPPFFAVRIVHEARLVVEHHRGAFGRIERRPVRQSLAVLSADTTADIEQRQVDAWRRLSSVERLRLVSDTTRAVMDLSLAGIRRRYPQASERECFLPSASPPGPSHIAA